MSTNQSALGGGGGITVTHTTRQLKAYNFTESDLDTIELTHIISGVSYSLAAAVAAFCIDVNKDLLIATDVPPEAAALQFGVNWIGIPIAIVFAAVGFVAQRKRGSVISRVKLESENVGQS